MSNSYDKRPNIVPEVKTGQVWQHHSGRFYTVLFLANESEIMNEKYPIMVIYQGENGKRWAGRLDDWHRRMTLISLAIICGGLNET